jgi:hypothetical protein
MFIIKKFISKTFRVFTGSVIAGIFLILLGIVILPPISAELSHKLKFGIIGLIDMVCISFFFYLLE